MTGYDASSAERLDGPLALRVDFVDSADGGLASFVATVVRSFIEAVRAGYFYPAEALGEPTFWSGPGLVEARIDVVGLPASALAVLVGMLGDAVRNRNAVIESAEAIVGASAIDLMLETGLRPSAASRVPFAVELPTSLDGNDTLLVEICFAEPIDPGSGGRMLDMLAVWEMLSLAYPSDPADPTENGGAQRHFNDPRTIHHHEWVWENVDPLAWNLLINLACAWHRAWPIVRLHIE